MSARLQAVGTEVLGALARDLAPLEARRASLAPRVWMVDAAAGTVTTAGAFWLTWPDVFHGGLFAIGGALLVGCLHGLLIRSFRTAYKAAVMPVLARALDPGLGYDARGAVPREAYEASGLGVGGRFTYKGEDLFAGRLGGQAFAMCEVRATHQATVAVAVDGTTNHLLFAETVIPPRAKGRVLVLPRDVAGRREALLKQARGFDPLPPEVATGDAAFDAAFSVRAKQAASVRLVVGPRLRAHLLELAGRKAPLRPWLSFHKDRLYVGLPCAEDLFEPDLFEPLDDAAALHAHAETLRAPLRLVELVRETLAAEPVAGG